MIVATDVLLDLGYQFFDTLERSSPYRALRDEVEPDSHLVEPGRIGWCVMHVPTFVESQPSFYLWMLARGIVIDNKMKVRPSRADGSSPKRKQSIGEQEN
jgi:hypothetical protein